MSMQRDRIFDQMADAWGTYLKSLEKCMDDLDGELSDATCVEKECTEEWCTATGNHIDELADSLYSIHEPGFISGTDSAKLKNLRRRVHDLYDRYRNLVKGRT
ncbi:MAG: hypothetical protein ACLFOY_15840 [Desulfatibacillaceae bacterium]